MRHFVRDNALFFESDKADCVIRIDMIDGGDTRLTLVGRDDEGAVRSESGEFGQVYQLWGTAEWSRRHLRKRGITGDAARTVKP